MKYINENSNRGIVNLFADFIVKEINKSYQYDVVIEVTDCGKFFVVNGMTNSNKILDMVTLKEKFIEQYKNLMTTFKYETINIIDLIMYDVELKKKTDYIFDFYDSSRPTYHWDVINTIIENPQPNFNSILHTNRLEYELDYSEDDISNLKFYTYSPLNISSEFPHGYSLSMGRQEYYYSEYICNHLFNLILTSRLTFKYSSNKVDDDNQIDIHSMSLFPKKDIISLILDVFDFDMLLFNDKLKDYDIMEDITKPFDKKPWLIKDRMKDLILF